MEFSFLIDMFGSFYAFFMRIATFLKFTPNNILEWFSLLDMFEYGFVNVFTGANVVVTLRESDLMSWILRYFSTVGLGDIPFYQGFLVQASTIWLFTIVVRVLRGLVT